MRSVIGRLTFRIALGVTLVVLVVTGVQAVVVRSLVGATSLEVRRRIVDEGVALTRLAARTGASEAMLRAHLGAFPTMAVVFYDAEGEVLARSRDDVPIREHLDADTRAAAIAGGGTPFDLTPLRAGERTEVIAAIDGRDPPSPVAFVGVFEDSPVLAMQSIRTWTPITVGAAVLAVALLLSAWLAARAHRWIARTESVVKRMSEGDLSVRLPVTSDDEIGALAGDFNRMADRLAEHVRRLEGEDERRKLLFAAFTHEINTPLTSVLGYLESLSMAGIDGDPQTRKRYVEIAFEQAQQLAALAEDLTTLSRLEYEGIELDRGELELGAVARREAAAFEAKAHARDVTIAVEGEPVVRSVDRARLGQILRVLLDNAIRHARAGSTVRVRVTAEGLEVCDEGEGIAPEHLAQLGTPLFRTDAARDRARGGRGLGLAIASGLAKAHGGRLVIRSELGRGTTAAVVLSP